MILNQCPKIVGLRLRGDYGPARRKELESQLAEAHNAEIVLIDVHRTSAIDAECMSSLVRLRKFLNGVCSIRMIGANAALRERIRAAGAARDLELPDAIGDVLGEIFLHARE